MVKYLKITPNGRLQACTNIYQDNDFKTMDLETVGLLRPYLWKDKKFNIMLYYEHKSKVLNKVGSALCSCLRLSNVFEETEITGTVFLANEHEGKDIDLTIADFNYLRKRVEPILGASIRMDNSYLATR